MTDTFRPELGSVAEYARAIKTGAIPDPLEDHKRARARKAEASALLDKLELDLARHWAGPHDNTDGLDGVEDGGEWLRVGEYLPTWLRRIVAGYPPRPLGDTPEEWRL